MPKFSYLAKKTPTDTIQGVLEAESRNHVLTHLTQLGYTPVRVTEASAAAATAAVKAAVSEAPVPQTVRVPQRKLNQFTRQFASLVRSQVPILRALSILEEQTSFPKLRKLVRSLGEEIRQGNTLSGALEKFPKVFSPLYVSLVRSGEVGGMLDTVLDRLATQADRDEELQGKIQSALAYPLFVAGVGFLTVMFLLSFVIPRLVKLFNTFGTQLPLPTRMLLSFAQFVTNGWGWMLAGFLLCIIVATLALRSPKGRTALAHLPLRLPMIGPMLCQIEITRFARSYGLLINQGVPILQATDIAIPVVGNLVLRRELGGLPKHLKDGQNLSSGLKGLKISTPLLVNTIAVGEESGKMGEALLEVSEYYEREAGRLLQLFAALVEPATILAVGAVVGFIVMAVLLPILTMGTIAR